MPVVIILFLILDFRVGFGDEGKRRQEFSDLSTSLSFEKLLLQIFIFFFFLPTTLQIWSSGHCLTKMLHERKMISKQPNLITTFGKSVIRNKLMLIQCEIMICLEVATDYSYCRRSRLLLLLFACKFFGQQYCFSRGARCGKNLL